MSFAFGFNNDDISDDEVQQSTQQQNPGCDPLSEISSQLKANPQFIPQLHTLSSILSKLENVRVTFDNFTTSNGNITYRRELYDIKHQVMCEDNNSELVHDILMGNGSETDLKKNVYEGGFKSWECSYDTVDALVKNDPLNENKTTILELGCGTSLPSCQILLNKLQSSSSGPLTLILSDYNYEVLRLVSLPNLLIHWASTLDVELLNQLCTRDAPDQGESYLPNDELLFTPKLIEYFQQDLTKRNIDIQFISGSWGNEFLSILQSFTVDLLISSETIYSLETLPIVAETIIALKSKFTGTKSLIAAKDFYFGVGGSVIEFVNYLETQKSLKSLNYSVIVQQINSQLKRSLITIE